MRGVRTLTVLKSHNLNLYYKYLGWESSMSEENSGIFHGDTPNGEDRIGRDDFVETVAGGVLGWKDDHALVMSISGEWGSGKTYVKNKIAERLKKKGCKVIDFNPWEWSAQDLVFSSFFTVISEELYKEDNYRKIAKYFQKFGRVLEKTEYVFSSMKKLAILIGATLVFIGVPDFPIVTKEIVEWIKLTIGSSMVLFGFSDVIRGYVTKFHSEDLSLPKLKKELKTQSGKLDAPIVVFIDDIDRLQAQEILTIFQLVKANSDFPNFVFVLLFDKEYVCESLAKIDVVNPAGFVEKIVQVPLYLPVTPVDKLSAIFYQDVRNILRLYQIDLTSEKRSSYQYEVAIEGLFTTIREVKRFCNMLKFSLAHIASSLDKSLKDYNIFDIIALEIIRYFEPDLYKILSSNVAILTGSLKTGVPIGKDERARERNEFLNRIENTIKSIHQERFIKLLLKETFPYAADLFTGKKNDKREISDDWATNKRVAHYDFFDQYFTIQFFGDKISQEVVDAWLMEEIPGDFEKFYEELREKDQHIGALKLLSRDGSLLDKIAEDKWQAFALIMMKLFEEVSDYRNDSFRSVNVYTKAVVMNALKAFKREERISFFKYLIKGAEGNYSLILWILDSDDAEHLFGADIGAIKTLVAGKLKENAINSESPHFAYILREWEKLDKSECELFVRSLLEQGQVCALLEACHTYGYPHENREANIYIELQYLNQYASTEMIKNSVEKLDRSELPFGEKWLVEAFLRASQLNYKGADACRVYKSDVQA